MLKWGLDRALTATRAAQCHGCSERAPCLQTAPGASACHCFVPCSELAHACWVPLFPQVHSKAFLGLHEPCTRSSGRSPTTFANGERGGAHPMAGALKHSGVPAGLLSTGEDIWWVPFLSTAYAHFGHITSFFSLHDQLRWPLVLRFSQRLQAATAAMTGYILAGCCGWEPSTLLFWSPQLLQCACGLRGACRKHPMRFPLMPV